jgi:DHA1 family multidrug resistance protein-like MFS transporter
MGAGMPLASQPLFHNLGVAWGNTIVGCLSVLFIPLPWLLMKYGPWLRQRSPMAVHDDEIEKARAQAGGQEEGRFVERAITIIVGTEQEV